MVKYVEKSKKVKNEDIFHYDVLIIGGGAGGLSAAIYSTRYGLSSALITKEIGGLAVLATKIENYPGYEGSGAELMQRFYHQAKKFGTRFLYDEVGSIEKDKVDGGFIVETKSGKIVHAKTLIITIGTEKRKLNIGGEEEFVGKGVSYCASCDAAFFKNKKVIVIGGSNSAVNAAFILSNFAKKIYISYRRGELRCEEIYKERLKKNKKIELILNSAPLEIRGDNKVKSIVLDIGGKKKEIEVDGVFVEIGYIPLTGLVKNLKIKTTKEGYVDVNENMETNIKGIFAAGDIVKSKLKQVVVAAAQGAIAAKSAQEYLQKKTSKRVS